MYYTDDNARKDARPVMHVSAGKWVKWQLVVGEKTGLLLVKMTGRIIVHRRIKKRAFRTVSEWTVYCYIYLEQMFSGWAVATRHPSRNLMHMHIYRIPGSDLLGLRLVQNLTHSTMRDRATRIWQWPQSYSPMHGIFTPVLPCPVVLVLWHQSQTKLRLDYSYWKS